jgi:hypothetical protein
MKVTSDPWRIAILIFFVGASVANIFAAKLGHDQLGSSPVVSPMSTPTANPFAAIGTPTPVPLFAGLTADEHRQVNDTALLRETVIITIAGIAWFLLPAVKKQAG